VTCEPSNAWGCLRGACYRSVPSGGKPLHGSVGSLPTGTTEWNHRMEPQNGTTE
jgi:hypothetical protein